jgi:hypothetical protein
MRRHSGRKCTPLLHTNYSQLLSSQEIEKTADEKILWSLYLPWELGRCAIESSGRQVDVRNVIWLGTSNIGHDLIFQYQELRRSPEELMSREEYLEVMGQLRPKVSERLGVRDFLHSMSWYDCLITLCCAGVCVVEGFDCSSFRSVHFTREESYLYRGTVRFRRRRLSFVG